MRHPVSGRLAGLLALVLALALAMSPAAVSPAAAVTTDYVANCGVNLRTDASLSATVLGVIPSGTTVTASGTISGAAWSTSCPGAVSGSSWYSITAVNGTPVSSAYGASVVYAATGLFSPVTSTSSSRLEGVDVSRWQGTIDFGAVKASGRSFVIAKASEGVGFTDPNWAVNKSGARAAGLSLGAYHYARPDLNPTNPAAEADWFVTAMGLTSGMLVPALDLEVAGGLSATDLTGWVRTFLDRVYADTGARAMIYVSPAFWRKYLGDTTWFADNGYTMLWIAHWTTAGSPDVPANNWSGHSWTFWQYTSSGSVPGISGRVDLDRYNGTDLTPVTYNPDFALAAAPTSASIEQGSSLAVAITITRDWFTSPVTFTVDGLPTGATADWTLNPASGGGSSLTIRTSTSGTVTPSGQYPITVTGTGTGLTRGTSMTLTVTPQVTRLYGQTKYDTSAAISAASFAPGVPVAYIATGTNFPDALTGAPVAGKQGAPLLLTDPLTLPPVIAAELARLRPGRIVVLGGPGAVTDTVLGALRVP